jgi:hypothetical protein
MPCFGIVVEDNSLGLNVMQAFHEWAYLLSFIYFYFSQCIRDMQCMKKKCFMII